MDVAQLSLARVYVIKLKSRVSGFDLLGPDQLYSRRADYLEQAMGLFREEDVAKRDVTIKPGVDHEGNLALEISATEDADTANYITAGTLKSARTNVDDVFAVFQKDIYTATGYTSGKQFFSFDGTDVKVSLNFAVNPQIFAATRGQERLGRNTQKLVNHYGKEVNGAIPKWPRYDIAQVGKSSLQITSSEENVAEVVAEALLAVPHGPQPRRRSIDTWPPATTPFWSISTLALAIFAVFIAPFKVTPVFLTLIALFTAFAVLGALITARISGASVPKTALGMTPSIIVFGFAVYYGAVMIGSHPAVKVAATGTPHLVDTFLLSVGMASTGGFFDLALGTTAVRVVAFAEMLSMVTVAGGSLYIGAHAAYDKLADLVRPGAPG